jgi:UDP-3-O-[3-hydroxymyristoyl] N-acetylglucosamine deacetylase / 3-hydroxyacyl-[acyl-carrier-protein] dehydratase
MKAKQHTLKKAITLSGIGLHTGQSLTMTLCPAPVNHWYKFQRIDLDGYPTIEASVSHIVASERGTVLEHQGVRVGTVEHVLSALVGLEIDNVLIQLNGPEVPILDGSAKEIVEAILSVGTEEQASLRNFYEVTEAVHYRNEDHSIELAALPLNDYRVTVMVDFNSSVLQSQHAQLHAIELYQTEIAPARTFVFWQELVALHKANLIKGGSLANAIVIADSPITDSEIQSMEAILGKKTTLSKKEGILNDGPLRFANEPARHKLLDVMGDLALIGQPLKAHILTARPGHSSNIALAKKIKKQMQDAAKAAPNIDVNMPPVLDVQAIAKLLPHRYPFQLVDKITMLDGTSVIGVKNITMNEPQFTGHFPDNPVMPGVLQIEAMAQVGGVLVLTASGDPEAYWPYLVSIDNCKFRRNVQPGDQMIIKCILTQPIKRGLALMHGEAWVGKNLVMEADMMAQLVKKTV